MNNKEKERIYRRIIPGKTRVYYLVEEYCQWHTFQEIFEGGPINRAPHLRSGIVRIKSRCKGYLTDYVNINEIYLSIKGSHRIRVKPEHIYLDRQEAVKQYKKYMKLYIKYLKNTIEQHSKTIDYLQKQIVNSKRNIKRKEK